MAANTPVTRPILIAHVTGPGNVIGSYRQWARGAEDDHEVSATYSGQFYSRIKGLGAHALVISPNPVQDHVEDDWIRIEHRPKNNQGLHGIGYHLAEIRYWLGVMRSIIDAKAKLAVVAGMDHWWLLTGLSLAGIKVIPTLHCTFWPKGHRPTSFQQRVIQWLNGWFWRHVPVATLSISPECERQVLELSGPKVKGALIQARPLYHRGHLDTIPEADWHLRPFRVLYAGRMERNKGIFDLLDLAERLRPVLADGLVFEVCGTGNAVDEFVAEVQRRKLSEVVLFLGQQNRDQMRAAYTRAHCLIVPTTAGFAEGLNKVVVEGVLSGRPLIATDVCPAVEITRNSTFAVPPGDTDAMYQALLTLATDEAQYERQRASRNEESRPFYEPEHSWGAALERAIHIALDSVPARQS